MACLLFLSLLVPRLVAETIPLHRSGGLLLVDVKVGDNGGYGRFILDTGAEESVLCRRVAERLGVKMVSKEKVRLSSGLTTAQRSEPLSLSIGANRFVSRGLLCLDLAKESRHLKTRIDGLLGMDFMSSRVLRIDLVEDELSFSRNERQAAKRVTLPLVMNFNALCVPVMIEGQSSYSMVRLDTGCDRSLCWVDEERGRRSGKPLKVSVSLAGKKFNVTKSVCFSKPLFPGEDGLLGMGVLSQFREILIDPPRKKVVLVP